jgi:TonB family protein
MATLSDTGTNPVAQRSHQEPELDLILHWEERHTLGGWLGIAALSVLLNLLVSIAVVQAPAPVASVPTERKVIVRRVPLYFPKDLLTQKAPNTRTPTKNIDLNDLLPAQASRARRAAPNPSTRHFEVPKSAPPSQTAKAAPQILPEAPRVATNQTPANLPPGAPNGLTSNIPPPPAPPPDQPFQNVGSEPMTSHPTLAVPKASVQSTIQSLSQPPNSDHLSINDDRQSQPSPAAPGIDGRTAAQHTQVELQSDPQGADFRNYLARVLAIVRGNWRRVIPDSVRMGTSRGRTVMEFIISRDGSIPKLVTADSSGSEALDRAAVAGLSMSNPLPPLPADFKGMQVRLAFTFSYNMPASQ